MQTELLERAREEYSKREKSKKWVDYYMRNVEVVAELTDGSLFVIGKKSVQKEVCFGYGYCGISNENEYRCARMMADAMRTDEQAFIEANLEDFSPFDETRYTLHPYIGRRGGFAYLRMLRTWQVMDCYDIQRENIKEASPEDVEIIRQAYADARAKFIKRIQAYLKRYGLSKVRSWTYLVD